MKVKIITFVHCYGGLSCAELPDISWLQGNLFPR